MEILNEKLEIYEEFGAVITYTFPQNKYIRTAIQSEDIVVPHRHPITSIDLSKAWFDDNFSEYLLSFLERVRGTAIGFRFRDPLDWDATKDSLVVDNTSTQGRLGRSPDGEPTEYQLFKVYRIGNPTIQSEIWRPITRPNDDILVYINGVSVAFLLDTTTGIITLDAAPASDAILTWQGTFDIPVRLETDESLPLQTIVFQPDANNGGRTLFNIPSLKLIEVKETSLTVNNTIFKEELNHVFALDLTYGSTTTYDFYGQKEELDSGFESIKSQAIDITGKVTLGDQLLTFGNTINYLISLFRCSMGSSYFVFSPDPTSALLSRFNNNIGVRVERDSETRLEQTFKVSNCNLVGRTLTLFKHYTISGHQTIYNRITNETVIDREWGPYEFHFPSLRMLDYRTNTGGSSLACYVGCLVYGIDYSSIPQGTTVLEDRGDGVYIIGLASGITGNISDLNNLILEFTYQILPL